MGDVENKAFSNANMRRERGLMQGMVKADKTGSVTKKSDAEHAYYDDPKVSQMGQISYEDTKRAMTAEGQKASDKEIDRVTDIKGSFHKGGKVKKSGIYRLKRGEKVLTKRQQSKRSGK